jgi:hypothetical protein
MDIPVLWAHPELQQSIDALAPPLRDQIQRKVTWAETVLGATTRKLGSKPTRHRDITWRRTPLKGFDYYLCWVELGGRGTQHLCTGSGQREVLLRVVREHDRSTDPLDPGQREDWQKVVLSDLDPRFDDQRSVVPDAYTPRQVRVIRGYPGSGKTIALLFCASDLASLGHVLYVTYTEKLADEARFFTLAYGLGDSVSVRTLAELESELLGEIPNSAPSFSPWEAYHRFEDTFRQSHGRSYRQFEGLAPMVWEELRAHLFGLALPFSWKRGDTQIGACDLLPPTVHKSACHADEPYFSDWDTWFAKLARQARQDGLMREQEGAREALVALVSGNLPIHPTCLTNTACIIVDEIQDLTPVQIALLAEVARLTCTSPDRDRSRPFAFIAAGDESQIVQPSGFEWGITKDLLNQRLDCKPEEITLGRQRRCPRRVAQLLNNTWPLYAGIQRRHQELPALPDDAADGDIIRCKVDAACDWTPFLKSLADSPGRAVVDLDGSLAASVAQLPEAADAAHSVLYTPQDIKGLDRHTVLVWALAETLAQFSRVQAFSNLALYARHVVGSIRVALSRSTDTLIILERDGPDNLDALELGHIDGVRSISWEALSLLLQESDLTMEERIEGFLGEADEALQSDQLDRALAKAKQARSLCDLVDDPLYTQRVTTTHYRIRRRYVEPPMNQARAALGRGEHASAARLIAEAKRALQEDDEQSLKKSVTDLEAVIRRYPAVSAMEEAEQHRQAGRIDDALASNRRASEHAAKLAEKALKRDVEEQYVRIQLAVANRYLAAGEPDEAERVNQSCRSKAAALRDAELQREVDSQHDAIERHRIEVVLSEAEQRLTQGDIAGARLGFQDAEKRALALTDWGIGSEVRSRTKKAATRHIGALLDEAEHRLAEGQIGDARQANLRAEEALGLAKDPVLVEKVANQHRRIDRQPAEDAMRLAEESLQDDDIDMALLANEEAEKLSLKLDDAELKTRVSEQRARVQLVQLLIGVESRLGREPLQDVYPAYRHLKSLVDFASVKMESIPRHAPRVAHLRSTIEPQLDQLATDLMRSAVAAGKRQDWLGASSAFQMAAEIRSGQHRPESADALYCLAERYREVPPNNEPTTHHLDLLMDLTTRYLACLESTGTGSSGSARGFARDWLAELLPHLPAQPELLLRWLPGARMLADWTGKALDVLFTELDRYGPAASRALRQSAVDPRRVLKQAQAEGRQASTDVLELCRLLDYVEGLLPF